MAYAIRKVGVVGGGTMGGGIAALVARSNRRVVVKEENEDLARKAETSIYNRFQKWFDLNKIDRNTLEQLKGYVTVTSDVDDLSGVDLAIEAIPENMEMKSKLLSVLDRVLPAQAVLASNTSSLPITELAKSTSRAGQVVGMHFFNPPTTMALVELVKGKETSEDTLNTVEKFARATLGKVTIRVADRPGFLVNCLLLPYLGEAVLALEQNEVSAEAIDAEARKFGWPMGPFGVLDVVGLDTSYFVAEFLSRVYPEKIQIGTLFKALVDAGRLGEKSGVGFYNVRGDHELLLDFLVRTYGVRPVISAQQVFEMMMARFLNEAAQALQDNVASKNDVETGAKIGIGFPRNGPLHYIDEIGATNLVKQLNEYWGNFGQRFRPAQILVDMAKRGETFFKLL